MVNDLTNTVITTISVTRATKRLLDEHKRGTETHDALILRLIDNYIVNMESDLPEWMKLSLKRMEKISNEELNEELNEDQ